VVGALIALPWLSLLPIANGAVAVLLFALTLCASFHGWGLAIGRKRDAEPVLAMQWGIAAVIGLAGVAMSIGRYGALIETLVLYAGVALHTAALARRYRERIPLRGPWLPAALLLIAIGTLAILGAAGDLVARPFDADGNLVGQLRGLADTGALGDPIGYPRAVELGGHAAIAALANAAGDPRLFSLIDRLAYALALALVLVRIRPRDAASGTWAAAIVVAASAIALGNDDGATWLAVGLSLALFTRDRDAYATGAVAGALVALRLAFAPVAVVGLAWSRAGWRGLVAMLAVAAPYLIAHGPIAWGRMFAGYLPLALAIAAALSLLIALAHRIDELRAIAALVLCVAIYDGRETAGRNGWYRRTVAQLDAARYLAHSELGPRPDLDALLAQVPDGARVAVWLPEPERVDHRRHTIVDLRTPGRRREHRWDGRASPLRQLLDQAHVRYLLAAPDDVAAQRRQQNVFEHAVCSPPAPAMCDDALDSLLRAPLATRDGLVLVELK